jgi:hypothetical protein
LDQKAGASWSTSIFVEFRLIEQAATVEQAKALDGSDKIFTDEGLLVPIIPDDPLLRTFSACIHGQ